MLKMPQLVHLDSEINTATMLLNGYKKICHAATMIWSGRRRQKKQTSQARIINWN